MSTTWQTVYEQLQEFLNECVKLWYINKKRPLGEFICIENYITNEIEFWLYDAHKIRKYSYHNLFSKDSGIMEFVEWRCKMKERLYHWIDWKYDNDVNVPEFHYMMMWPLTAEEKIIYFLKNAKLPTKSE